MCLKCGIKNPVTNGAVVKIVRRCKSRTGIDKGKHLADKKALVYITRIAPRGEGFYGYVINVEKNKFMKTEAHFRDCEHTQTEYIWITDKLILKEK
ncbi:hypothetical protein ABZ756_03825 [Mammaliicoccus sciuri]